MSDGSVVGIITDIHRSSIVDGPGIRTTVFLKGCPLSCIWCHNPETQKPFVELGYQAAKCIGCGACIDVCPQKALQMKDGKVLVDRDLCNNGMQCVEVCPVNALFSYGRKVSVEEVVKEVLKDRIYYDESGGGVTISGGEPMMQPCLTIGLLAACKEKGLHTCLDTSGVGKDDDFLRTLPLVDLYLFDYKASVADTYRLLTGAHMHDVLHVFSMLYDAGKSIRLRCPLIPGVNDSDDHLAAIARISNAYPNLEGVDILGWHAMGTEKYAMLGRCMHTSLPTETVSEPQKECYRAKCKAFGVQKFRVI
jgi:pyruvate formate lyase activating enzyme